MARNLWAGISFGTTRNSISTDTMLSAGPL